MRINNLRRTAEGFTLIELIVFIMIVSVAVAGVLSVLTVATKSSSDPRRARQANVIAQYVLDDVISHPMRSCDLGSAAPTDCPGRRPRLVGMPTAAARTTTPPPTYVEDYAGHSKSPLRDEQGRNIPGLSEYSTTVTLTPDGSSFGAPPSAALRVDVLVSYSGGHVTLTGYRFRYPSDS